jgi:hypothetical protein
MKSFSVQRETYATLPSGPPPSGMFQPTLRELPEWFLLPKRRPTEGNHKPSTRVYGDDMQPTRVLQPGRYSLVRSGQADARIVVKYLQIGVIAGHTSTGRNTPSATLDQLVLVRIQVRQLKEYLQNRQNTVSVDRRYDP